MPRTLRQRIRAGKINCLPWKRYRGEIRLLPISAQCLFSNKGLPWDILEIELKREGWLLEWEELWEVLSQETNMKRTLNGNYNLDEPFDDTWTDEDYKFYYNQL